MCQSEFFRKNVSSTKVRPRRNYAAPIVIFILALPVSVAFGQGTEYKRWEYLSGDKVVRFTGKFIGLDGEAAVFSNRENKRAKIPLDGLTRDSLEDLVVSYAPVIELPASSERDMSETDDGPRWLGKLNKDFAKAVNDLEKFRSKLYAGSDKWTEPKKRAKDKEFLANVADAHTELTLPCKIVSILNASRSEYAAKLSSSGIEDFQLSHLRTKRGIYISQVIDDVNVDVGTKVKLDCDVSISTSSKHRNNPLGVLESGITINGRTYYLLFRLIHVK